MTGIIKTVIITPQPGLIHVNSENKWTETVMERQPGGSVRIRTRICHPRHFIASDDMRVLRKTG